MAENKYEIVKKGVQEMIEQGNFNIGDKLPTESELMERYQVSRYTVRRAIGDLQNAHYVYRIQGGGMYVDDWQESKSQLTINNKMIGVVTTHLADYIFPSIISGIDRAISAQGYSLIVSNTHNNREKERQSLQQMIDNKVAGLIIEPTQSALPDPNIDLYQKIQEAGIPMIFINAHYPEIEAPYLEVNDTAAEQAVVNHLIKLGHQRILGIFQVDDMQGTNRLKGFINAYMSHPEISYLSKTVMYQSGQDMTKVFEQVSKIMDTPDRPTAVVCYNDELAIQIMDVIRSLDLAIPSDVSIVGFDDFVLTRYLDPELATVEHPKEKMGLDAGKMIVSLVKGEDVSSIKYDLDLELTTNGSVSKLKAD
ncbi:GntR family transcriptional regulator [Limosilactobacillus fermentum]|uniref:GntR family transcriptional regulator n=1 Tax=Limosilactobacillus fermentum TaxID=1613 RepID=UPI002F2644C2